MVGLDAVVAFTDELERQLARLEELPAASVPAAVRRRRPRVPQAQDLPRRDSWTASPPVPLKLFPEYEAMQHARGVQGCRAHRPLLPRPVAAGAAHRAARRRAGEPVAVAAGQAAPAVPARTARVAARRRGWRRDDARRDRRHRGRRDAVEPARVLVDGGRAVRGAGRRRARGRLRREAARGAHRPADPSRRRRPAKVADRLRREVLYYVAIAAPVGPQVQAVQRTYGLAGLIPSPEVLGDGRRAAAAEAPRGARAARRRQGHLAQVRLRPRREPAQAQADADVGAHQGRRDEATAR